MGVQAEFSAGKTRQSSDVVVDNFVNALLYHGDLVNALLENRFCFAIMSYHGIRWLRRKHRNNGANSFRERFKICAARNALARRCKTNSRGQ